MEDKPPQEEKPCKVEPDPSWSDQEKWVWERVCAGKVADFNQKEGKNLDPKKPEEWTESRVVSSKFLETILLEGSYKEALTRKGVQISGAWFKEQIDISLASLAHRLSLEYSLFDSHIDISFLRSSYDISFNGSKFNSKLNMTSLKINSSFYLCFAEVKEVDMLGAKIEERLNISGSKFYGKLNMDKIEVKSSLFMRGGAEFKDVILRSAEIVGHLDMSSSKFHDILDMDSIKVKNALHMSNQAEFKHVILRSAKIDGQIAMNSSKFHGILNMDSINVESHLFMSQDAEFKNVSLVAAKIGGGLDISNSKLSFLDLTGAKIRGEFRLGSSFHPQPKWGDKGKLILLNTAVGALQDLKESWPDKIELTGFTYSRLGGFGVDPQKSMAERDISWLKEWLEKQKHYSPQPYEQLGKILREAGYSKKAKDILFEGKKREQEEAFGSWLNWFNLALQRTFVGYGYRYLRTFGWFIGLVLLGASILWVNEQSIIADNWLDRIFYSLDKLLPIVKLSEIHYLINREPSGFTKYYFYFHTLFGFVLASYLIAGLSGITKK